MPAGLAVTLVLMAVGLGLYFWKGEQKKKKHLEEHPEEIYEQMLNPYSDDPRFPKMFEKGEEKDGNTKIKEKH